MCVEVGPRGRSGGFFETGFYEITLLGNIKVAREIDQTFDVTST